MNTCGRNYHGKVKCWGMAKDGLKDVPSIGAVWLAVGNRHACIITLTQEMYCWGWNMYGQTDGEREEDRDGK